MKLVPSALALLALLALGPAFAPLVQEAASPPAAAADSKALDAWIGTWTAEVEAGGQRSQGREVCRRDYGGTWIVSEFEGEIFGAPFKGLGLLGYDEVRRAYVSTWIDSVTPSLTVSEGQLSADGKVLKSTATGVDSEGQPVVTESITTFRDARTRVFELAHVQPDGSRFTGLKITYTRKE